MAEESKDSASDLAMRDLAAPGLPGEARADGAGTPAAYWRAFSLVTFTMNRFIVDHVLRAARQFDNDTETMILFGTIAHLNSAHLVAPGSRPSSMLGADGRVPDAQPQLRPVRLRDLVQITGRPRETIRRKLESLAAQGRILRGLDGYVIAVSSIDEQMRALSVDGVRRFTEASRLITAALQDAEQALAEQSGQP